MNEQRWLCFIVLPTHLSTLNPCKLSCFSQDFRILCPKIHIHVQYRSRTTFQWESSGISWNILEYYGILQDIMEYSRSLLFHFILEYSRMLQNILKYSKIFKNTQKYLRIFGNILFQNILEYSEIIGKLFPSGTVWGELGFQFIFILLHYTRTHTQKCGYYDRMKPLKFWKCNQMSQ